MDKLDQGLVPIVFKLTNFQCPKRLVPAIIGNICELGEWKFERAIKASPLIYEGTDSKDADDNTEEEVGNKGEFYKTDTDKIEHDKKECDKEGSDKKGNDKEIDDEKGNDKERIDKREQDKRESDTKGNDKKERDKIESDREGNDKREIGKEDSVKNGSVKSGFIDQENDDQVWFCEVNIPAKSVFEWNWVLVSRDEKNTNFYDIEQTVKRRDNSGYFKKIFPSNWEKESFHPNHIPVAECDVKISLLDKPVFKNQRVCLLGSIPATGCWLPKRSILATKSKERPNQWDVQVKLPLNSQPVYWKWALMNVRTRNIESWETRLNRTLHVRTDYLALLCYWNESGEAVILTTQNPRRVKVSKVNEVEKKAKLFKQVKAPDIVQPQPCLFLQLIRDIYQIYRALKPDGSIQYRRFKHLAYAKDLPTLNALVDVTSDIQQYQNTIVFQVTDGGKKNGLLLRLMDAEMNFVDYPDPDDASEMSFTYLMKLCEGDRNQTIGERTVPYENEITKKDKTTSWIKRTFYNKQTNIKFEFILKPEADYCCIRPPELSPQIHAKDLPKHCNMRPKAGTNGMWWEPIPKSDLKGKDDNQADPPTKISKSSQTRTRDKTLPEREKDVSLRQKKPPDLPEKVSAVETEEIHGLLRSNTETSETEGLLHLNSNCKRSDQLNTEMLETAGLHQSKEILPEIKGSQQFTVTETPETENIHEMHTTEIPAEQKTKIENIKGHDSLNLNVTEKHKGLYQTLAEDIVNEGLYQTDVDTGKRERFDTKDTDAKNGNLFETDTNNGNPENLHERNTDLFETNIDTGKHETYFPKIKPYLFNTVHLMVRIMSY